MCLMHENVNFGVNIEFVSRDDYDMITWQNYKWCPSRKPHLGLWRLRWRPNQLFTELSNFDWLRILTVAQPKPVKFTHKSCSARWHSAMWHDIATHEIARSPNHENKPHEIDHSVLFHIKRGLTITNDRWDLHYLDYIVFRGISRALQPVFAKSAHFMMCHCIKRWLSMIQQA